MFRELKLVLNIANTFLNGDHTHLRDVVFSIVSYDCCRKNRSLWDLIILFP